jgi:hypothetical protein
VRVWPAPVPGPISYLAAGIDAIQLGKISKKPTPYMEKLRFQPGQDTGDTDEPLLSDEDLEKACAEGQERQ